MAMNWPAFIEYTEEFRDIAKGSKSKEALPAAPIMLINQRPVAEDVHEYQTTNSLKKNTSNKSSGKTVQQQQESSTVTTTVGSNKSAGANATAAAASSNRNSGVTNGNGKADPNPFEEEEEWDDTDNVLVDNGEPGVPVKALYDYEGAESDELSFKQGDIFEKLEDEDEQGWCKGRMNGRVGLYPANYVEPMST
ncbi:antigen EM13-like [Teleopsis dalmanni]|uniref:antigen EM13-like n=1 Tax=Teleopsis dalmanni TaxID=139649 RepID=UPI0018CCA235|nr:antigen EM13-like [Teleopsis dalmanni]